jgi:D-alanine--poly(phosphoribitol) ligase subunit 1
VWKAYALPSLMDESLNGIPDPPTPAPADRIAYLLFTSGTTGKPKGVPITYGNLSSYVNAFERTGIVVGPEDRVLQMFELVFDVSVSTILMAFLNGACLYPLSGVRMKYIQIHELLHDHDITVAFLVPSILNYLRPYFDEIRVESLRTCMFAGEALNHHVVSEWQSCAPGARLYNLYGPTEATIVCMAYECSGNLPVKSHNGTISIGKAMSGMLSIVVDDDGRPLPPGQTGHLYLSGPQVTHGYWKRQDINRELFVDVSWNGVPTRFYKSGDLCLVDDDGDFFYLGRSDHQVKVGGFRVELGEVEFHCRALIGKRNAVAVVLSDSKGNTELRLVVESEPFDTGGMLEELRSKVPPYMVPRQVHFLNPFPMNINGKTDRGAIVLQIREVGL